MVHQTLSEHPIPDTAADQEVGGPLLEDPSPDPRFHVGAVLALEHHGGYAGQV
jgi:hypothetical protein